MNKFTLTHQRSAITLAIATLAMVGCGSDSNSIPATQAPTENEGTQFDATSDTEYTYVNLNTGETVDLTAEQAASSSDWHIGLRRTAIIVNGGDSGSGNVAAALAASQDDFYNGSDPDVNVFLNASSESELEHLTTNYDLTSLTFSQDEIVAAIEGSGETTGTSMDLGWYNYDFTTHITSLNSSNWWLLKSSAGDSYAKFHATAFSYNSTDGMDVTFEFDVQAANTSQFAGTATFDAHADASGGEECFDFDTNTAVDCSSDDWDLKLEIAGRSFNLWTNSGVSADGSGGAFGPFTTAEIADYTAGDTVNGTNIAHHYSTDTTEGVFTESSWYAYNLEGNHKLWPNYRTFVVDTDTTDADASKYKLQVTDYYSELDTSGYLTIRFEENE